MRCSTVFERIPPYVGEGDSTRSLRRHLATCERCSEEAARYVALLDSLGGLEAVTAVPPPDLAPSLAAIPTRRRAGSLVGHLLRNRGAYVGGAAVAVAGAATVLWRTRTRRVATA